MASFSLNSYQFSFCFVRLRVLPTAHKKSHAQKNQQQNPASFSHTESPFRTTSRFQVTNFPPAALQYALFPCLFTITASKICAAVNNDDVSMYKMKQFIPGMLLFLRSLSSLYRRQCRDKPSSGLSRSEFRGAFPDTACLLHPHNRRGAYPALLLRNGVH